MANYTMTIAEMVNNPLTPVFPSNYPFYCDDKRLKKEFEETFILHYLTNEIGFETPYLFNQKLLGKLKLIMPYYEQLYQTEWHKVRSVEQMMTSKNLIEKTTHEQKINGQSSSHATSSNNDTQTGTNESSSNSNQSMEQTDTQNSKSSSLSDGVAQASLTDGYLTGVSQNQNTSTNETTGTNTSSQNVQTTLNSTASNQMNGNTEQILTETNIFESKGDIGIQTPAYAITEWRKIILNINQMIIEDCRDLFMKIY